MLGPLAVWTSGGDPVQVPEAKVRALLAVLLAAEGRPVPVDRIADELWGDDLPGDPANTLQTKVSQLRRALDRAEPGARKLVVHQAPGYRLAAESVDVRQFRELAGAARLAGTPGEKARLLTEALALWRGPAFADFADEPFAAASVQRLDEERLAAAEELAEARLELGEHDAVIGELGELIARHPLRERSRGLRMRALYQAGRQGEALADFTELRTRLADDLGIGPGPELSGLHQAILRHELPRPAAPARTNLPAPVTELVGRTGAVAAIRSRLGAARLVTLTGPGGVGKTRLAEECARGLVDDFADGVWLVEFAGVRDGWVAAAVATALGVREEAAPAGPPPAGLADRLVEVLRGKEILLVLDNCEQLVEPLAELVARLLRAAPGLRVLATSREPLGLAGEVLWAVAPLDVPEVPPADRSDEQVLAAVRDFAAVRLFTARAAATSDFVLDAGNARAVAALCRGLDGIPLALELAATRVRALGVHEVLERLDDRFRLLVKGHRDAPARQRTLRAVIDWSWGLLTEAERTVLRRLAVHAEGCRLDAAEAVCSGEGVRPEEVADLLDRLVDRSLVVCRPGPRYRLLESVTAYCLEQLAAEGELQRLRDRHARFYLELAERADPRLRGPEQRRWLERLDADAANLRSALETLGGQADRLVRALLWYWFLRGRFGEARQALRSDEPDVAAWRAALGVLAGDPVDEDAFARADDIADPALRARVRWFLGYVKSTIGDLADGEVFTERALREFRALDDRWGIAAAHSDRASQAMSKGDFAAARREARLSAELFAELGDRWGQLQASFALGSLAETGGDHEQAARLHREGLRKAEELGLLPEVAYQLTWLGRVALLSGDFEQAQDYHERAVRLAAEQGFRSGELYAETGLALGERRRGRLDRAETHLRKVLAWYRESGFHPSCALILAELGFVAELRGDAAGALRWHAEGFALARRSGDPRALALAGEGLAGAHALSGDHVRAARLLGAAAKARESVGTPLPKAESGDVDRITEAARAALGGPAFEAEFGHGGQQTIAEASGL
ncbi:BTAD domain-containing putative transcriptional regulator [Saccharopolyspora taberi]|uniref:BTAD domain-containing putative transcriptional regulator n=1 Tax=Saccharopolyspora taberi TaxID=60895 RepID=A0ABN3VGG3_9PSEU